MATSLFLIKSVLEFVSGEEDGDESESAEDNDDGDNEDETNDVDCLWQVEANLLQQQLQQTARREDDSK